MERRRLMFMGLAGAVTATFGLAATAKAGILGDTTGLSRGPMADAEAEALAAHEAPESETLEDGVQLAQYPGRGPGPGPGRGRRRPRCWYETRNVRYRDRWGRVQFRRVRRQVCR